MVGEQPQGCIDVPNCANVECNVEAGIRRCYSKLMRHRFQGCGTLKAVSLRKVRFGKIFKGKTELHMNGQHG